VVDVESVDGKHVKLIHAANRGNYTLFGLTARMTPAWDNDWADMHGLYDLEPGKEGNFCEHDDDPPLVVNPRDSRMTTVLVFTWREDEASHMAEFALYPEDGKIVAEPFFGRP
jgi:hypothetical protein